MIQCVCDVCGKVEPVIEPILRLKMLDAQSGTTVDCIGISPPNRWLTRNRTHKEKDANIAKQDLVVTCGKECAEKLDAMTE